MSDSLRNGRKFRTFNVIDDFNIECLGIIEDYNYYRPHESLNNVSPISFLSIHDKFKFSVDLMDNAKALPTTPQL